MTAVGRKRRAEQKKNRLREMIDFISIISVRMENVVVEDEELFRSIHRP